MVAEGGKKVTVAAGERRARQAYLMAKSAAGEGTLRLDVAPPGMDVRTELDNAGPSAPGSKRKVAVVLSNSQPVAARGTVSVWAAKGVQVAPASAEFDVAPGAQLRVAFEAELAAGAEVAEDGVMLYPQVKVASLSLDGQPLAVPYPDPNGKPEVDKYTTLLCQFASADAITKPAAGPAGTLNLADGSFEKGPDGTGVWLKAGGVSFPAPSSRPGWGRWICGWRPSGTAHPRLAGRRSSCVAAIAAGPSPCGTCAWRPGRASTSCAGTCTRRPGGRMSCRPTSVRGRPTNRIT